MGDACRHEVSAAQLHIAHLSTSFIQTGPEIFSQGVLLSWTKKFKARGVQDTDVVSRLTKAMRRHKVRNSPQCERLSQP